MHELTRTVKLKSKDSLVASVLETWSMGSTAEEVLKPFNKGWYDSVLIDLMVDGESALLYGQKNRLSRLLMAMPYGTRMPCMLVHFYN